MDIGSAQCRVNTERGELGGAKFKSIERERRGRENEQRDCVLEQFPNLGRRVGTTKLHSVCLWSEAVSKPSSLSRFISIRNPCSSFVLQS